MLTIHLSNAGESPPALSAEVRCTLTSTTITVDLNTSLERRPSASDFQHILTVAAPGNNVDSLCWAALNRYRFRYAHQVQRTASTTWPPMEVCYPDLGTGIASLCFDRLDTGYPCAVEDVATGQLYTRMRVINNDGSLGPETELKFTSGTVLLVAQKVCQPATVQAFTKSLAPGADDRTLTYALQSRGMVRYNETNADGKNAIRAIALEAITDGCFVSTMEIFYPTMATQIGYLDFDPLNVGHECELVLDGVCYQGNIALGTRVPLTFTNGSVLLSV